jgi:hypothetical protein
MVLSKTARCLMLNVLRKSLNGAVAEVGHNNTKNIFARKLFEEIRVLEVRAHAI